MSYKEWNAAVLLVSAVLVAGWLGWDALSRERWNDAPSEIAATMLWALLASILLNVAGMIAVAILVSIARREELRDERSDERDWSVGARAMRNAYGVLSVGGALVVVATAMGYGSGSTLYLLMAGLLAAAATDASSRLIYYRLG